jgi:hypothetical protein
MRLRHSSFSSVFSSVLAIACLIQPAGSALAEPLVLQGSIEHSDVLQPLDTFKVGADFDSSLLPTNESCEGNWWRVPNWLAGKWHKNGKLKVLSFIDVQTKAPVPTKKRIHVNYPDNEVLGHQTDTSGQVWTFVPLPCVGRTYSGDQINVNIYHSFDLVDEKQDSITVRLFLVTLIVNKDSNKVISVCQRESLQTWTALDDDTVSILDSTKFFDRDGVPLAEKKILSQSQKCGDYCPVNYIDRSTHRPLRHQAFSIPADIRNSQNVPLDLRNSLADFLRTKKLTSLIP